MDDIGVPGVVRTLHVRRRRLDPRMPMKERVREPHMLIEVGLFPGRQPVKGEKQKEYQEESEALAVKVSQRRARARGGYLRGRAKFHLSVNTASSRWAASPPSSQYPRAPWWNLHPRGESPYKTRTLSNRHGGAI